MRPEIKYGLLAGVAVLIVASVGYFMYQSSREDKPKDTAWLKNSTSTADPNKVATPMGAKPGATSATPGRAGTTPPAVTPARGPNTPISPAPRPVTPTVTQPPAATPAPAGTPPLVTPAPATTRPSVLPAAPSLPPLAEPATRPAPLPSPSGPLATPQPAPPRDSNAPTGLPAPAVDPNRRSTGPAVEPPAPLGAKPGESTLPKPAEPAKPAAPPAGAKTHKVAAGESLWVIAEDYYGDGHLWKKIRDANPGIDENRLLEGQVLVIPPKEGPAKPTAPTGSGAPAAAPSATAKPTDPNKPTETAPKPKARKATYRVEAGDTLVSIARAILKDGERWREIYELNKDKIKDPNRLLVGTELKLPE